MSEHPTGVARARLAQEFRLAGRRTTGLFEAP
jgi:hypothetical protein